MMQLELGTFPVECVRTGWAAGYADGTLTVDLERLRARCLDDPRVVEVEIYIVEPGESTRIVHVRDVIEPRVKVSGEGHVYPAICGHPPDTVGDGVTHRFSGFAILIAADVPGNWLDHRRLRASCAAAPSPSERDPRWRDCRRRRRHVSRQVHVDPGQ